MVNNINSYQITPEAFFAVKINKDNIWSRRVNLTGTTTVHLNITEAGTYRIVTNSENARFRIEPFLIRIPKGYKSPPFKYRNFIWNLNKGIHTLTMKPEKKGVINLSFLKSDNNPGVLEKLKDMVKDFINTGKKDNNHPFIIQNRYSNLKHKYNKYYTLYLNQQPEIKTGIILRKTPIDLEKSLPIALRAQEIISLPVKVSNDGYILAYAEDNSLGDLSKDKEKWMKKLHIKQGRNTLHIKNHSDNTLWFSLRFNPDYLNKKSPFPIIKEILLSQIPDFKTLKDRKPYFFDLEKNSSKTFQLQVSKPSIYNIFTTGLINTEGNLRSRTIVSLNADRNSGTGRNFQIGQYLREGDYQLTAKSLGDSAGHLGITLKSTKLIDGGFLTEGIPARVTLDSEEAIEYRFKIEKKGYYTLKSIGAKRTFICRVEDSEGWPIIKPNSASDLLLDLDPGAYKIILMPEPIRTKRVTYLEFKESKEKFEGHGPHTISIGKKIEHEWKEPEDKKERIPDIWEFTIPSDVFVNISINNEMIGELSIKDKESFSLVSRVHYKKILEKELKGGTYKIELKNIRKNNKVSYNLKVTTKELLTGGKREVSTPTEIAISIGESGIYEIYSFGKTDVSAKLFNGTGKLIAKNDDRTNDWNFLITELLSPGRYTLKINPSGSTYGNTKIYLKKLKGTREEELSFPADLNFDSLLSMKKFPLNIPNKKNFILIKAESKEELGIQLNENIFHTWKKLAFKAGDTPTILLPLKNERDLNSNYVLTLLSSDRQGNSAKLKLKALSLSKLSEKDLANGIKLKPVKGFKTSAIFIKLKKPGGVFKIKSDLKNVCYSPAIKQQCKPTDNNNAFSSGDYLWLAADINDKKSRTIKGERVIPVENKEYTFNFTDEMSVDIKPNYGPVAAIVTSRNVQPSINIKKRSEIYDLTRTAFSKGSSLAISLNSKDLLGTIKNAEVKKVKNMGVKLKIYTFNKQENKGFKANINESIKSGSFTTYNLPEGTKKIKIALGKDSAFIIHNKDISESTHWIGGKPFEEELFTDARNISIFNLSEKESRYSFKSVSVYEISKTNTFYKDASFERYFSNFGILRLQLSDYKEGSTLHIRGALNSSYFIDNVGTFKSGKDILISNDSGILIINHKPGFIYAWIEPKDKNINETWGSDSTDTKEISLPSLEKVSNTKHIFKLVLDNPQVLHLKSDSPMITLVKSGNSIKNVSVHEKQAMIEIYLEAGVSEIKVLALFGRKLWGTINFSASPVAEIGEGLGPVTTLSSNDTKFFTFKLMEKLTIGVGVRSSSDMVTGKLYNSSGKLLDKGIVMMPELNKGLYLLALTSREEESPVTARPALLGIKSKNTAPPNETIKKYIDMERKN